MISEFREKRKRKFMKISGAWSVGGVGFVWGGGRAQVIHL